MSAPFVFAVQPRHGACMGVAPRTGAMPDSLHVEERAFASSLTPARRPIWIAGRLAMRAALERIGVEAGPVLADDRGAPRLPPGAVGSISHKQTLALAIAVPADDWTLGIDLENAAPRKTDISRRVLTAAECDDIGALSGDERSRAVVLRFSIKEAIYKAIDPFLQRYVGFREVSVFPSPDGGVEVELRTARKEPVLEIDAVWTARDGMFVSSARARLCRGSAK